MESEGGGGGGLPGGRRRGGYQQEGDPGGGLCGLPGFVDHHEVEGGVGEEEGVAGTCGGAQKHLAGENIVRQKGVLGSSTFSAYGVSSQARRKVAVTCGPHLGSPQNALHGYPLPLPERLPQLLEHGPDARLHLLLPHPHQAQVASQVGTATRQIAPETCQLGLYLGGDRWHVPRVSARSGFRIHSTPVGCSHPSPSRAPFAFWGFVI